MKRSKLLKTILFSLLSSLILTTISFADDIDPKVIIEKTIAAYKAIDTYKAEGTVTLDAKVNDIKTDNLVTFSILLKKPNLYLISWTASNIPKTRTNRLAVWNNGSQAYLYMGPLNVYSKETDDLIALAGATGISLGVANTIPSIFFPMFKDNENTFSRLTNTKLEKMEQVDGEDCYVITGESDFFKQETYWISIGKYLIRKYYRSMDTPEGGIKTPKFTDEQYAESIKASGREVTAETLKLEREEMEHRYEELKNENVKMTGSSIEIHSQISSPELSPKDFQFTVPEGTVLK